MSEGSPALVPVRVTTHSARHVAIATHVSTAEPIPANEVRPDVPAGQKVAWHQVVGQSDFNISVIIPTLNVSDSPVRRCVECLPDDAEVIVVLTGPDTLDTSWCTRPNVRFAQDLERPFVFGRANNIGARLATGDAFLFCNDDCWFRNPADVRTLISVLHDPSAGAVSPLASYSGNPDIKAPGPTGVVSRTHRPINGFCLAMRRSVFWGIGGWDERWRGYGTDDDDLCTSILSRRYRLLVDGRVHVEHEGHASFGRDWDLIRREIDKWGEVFRAKWGFGRDEIPERFTDPDATFVIPAYNCERWIGPCLQSVFAQQSPAAFDVVVVDDGSTDGTLTVLRRLKRAYGERLIVLTQENRGPSAARNRGVKRSLGKAIIFQDGDDLAPSDRLTNSLSELAAVDVSYGQCNYFPQDGCPEQGQTVAGIINPHPDHVGHGNGFRIGASAFRRLVFDEYGIWLDERLAVAEDHELFIHCMAKGLTARAAKCVMLDRRRVSGSLRTRGDYPKCMAYIGDKHGRFLDHVKREKRLPPRGEDWTGKLVQQPTEGSPES